MTGKPVTARRYEYLRDRLGEHLPWVSTWQVSTHWLRHTILTWAERSFGIAVAQAYAGHQDARRGRPDCDARGQDQELAHRQAGPGAGVRVAAAAPYLPGRRQGQVYREDGKVRRKTVANLSKTPASVVDAVEAALKGEVRVPAGHAAVTVARSLPHGHAAAAYAMASRLGQPRC